MEEGSGLFVTVLTSRFEMGLPRPGESQPPSATIAAAQGEGEEWLGALWPHTLAWAH